MPSYPKRLPHIPFQAIRGTRPSSGMSITFGYPNQRYVDARARYVEYLEDYCPGGYCPLSLGSRLNGGVYEVVHKLGSGATATVWAAEDLRKGGLLAIKVLQADANEQADRELDMLEKLQAVKNTAYPEGLRYIRTPLSTFREKSANGVHQCLVQPLAGPSLSRVLDYGARTEGSVRFRADLMPRFAWQAASTVKLVHGMDIALHDIRPGNWSVQVKNEVHTWSKQQLYKTVGAPETEPLLTFDDSPVEPHGPRDVTIPADMCQPSMAAFLDESIMCIDLGDTVDLSRPNDEARQPTVPLHYRAPESLVNRQISRASDIWSLGLMLFELLTGYPLIDGLFATEENVLWEQGRLFDLPDGSLAAALSGQHHAGVTSRLELMEQRLREVGREDDRWDGPDGPMVAPRGKGLADEDIERWTRLLTPMLRLRPEDRPSVERVLEELEDIFGENCGVAAS